jgi:predicted acetyltransferase
MQMVKNLLSWGTDLSAVGTATKYRKQGAASLCLEWGTTFADKKGLPGYVEGTPIGTSIYRRYGFEVVDHLKMELSPWNAGKFWNVCMVRPAKQ